MFTDGSLGWPAEVVLTPSADRLTQLAARVEQADERPPDPLPPRVLVADDHVANRKVAVSMLASLGLRADAAASGREALDLLRRMRYDLVLMDCQMPGMSGQEAAAEIRRREGSSHHTPIVSMADNAKRDCQQRCLDCGMDDILHKPVRMQSLLEVVEKWIFRPGTVIVLSSSATAVDSRGGKVAAGTPGGFGPTTPQA